jgi:hypothetical protein
MTLHGTKQARDGGKMWSESDTVRFLEEWLRLSREHPDSSRTEVPQFHVVLNIYLTIHDVENTNDQATIYE